MNLSKRQAAKLRRLKGARVVEKSGKTEVIYDESGDHEITSMMNFITGKYPNCK